MNLETDILSRLDNDILLKLYNEFPSLRIDLEFGKRLQNCDFSVLDVLFSLELTEYLVSAVKNFKYCIPWKIAVVYNYETGAVKDVIVSLDIKMRYKIGNKPILFTWLDCNNHGLMIREITNYKQDIFSLFGQSHDIIDLLLNSNQVKVDLGFFQGRKTFEVPLSYRENYEVVPLAIESEQGKKVFLDTPPNSEQIVKVTKSANVDKYIKLSKKWKIF